MKKYGRVYNHVQNFEKVVNTYFLGVVKYNWFSQCLFLVYSVPLTH